MRLPGFRLRERLFVGAMARGCGRGLGVAGGGWRHMGGWEQGARGHFWRREVFEVAGQGPPYVFVVLDCFGRVLGCRNIAAIGLRGERISLR